jgi:alpha-mannosidase
MRALPRLRLAATAGLFAAAAAAIAITITTAVVSGQSATPVPAPAPSPSPAQAQAPDLATQPTLYVVGYSHLDTQWRWEYPQVIREFLPRTMRDNFALFEKYPSYIFTFTGANRYRMMKEYYPADYARLTQYVAAGRWFPGGSSMEEGDVLVSAPESILRQVLYGNQYFQRDFGKTSVEYMLPDCFGFPASLPSLLAHAGLTGFSTQKLGGMWGSAVGIPFNVGRWDGPDGRGIIAALNPGSYNSQITEDLTKSESWIARIKENGAKSGLFVDYHYYGGGDTGGAPREASVKMLDAIARKEPPLGDGPLRVVPASSAQMFLNIKPSQAARLPRYAGDLLLTEHSAGSLTSQAYMKRWNHQNERLADAAERASIAAEWLGGPAYPRQRLTDAWTLVLGAEVHDVLPGTSSPKAYEYSWNDEILASNQFAGVLTSATDAIAAGLDTQTGSTRGAGAGTAVIVYNPLSIAREDLVEATVPQPSSLSRSMPPAVRVIGPDGAETPAQLIGTRDSAPRVLFLARVPPVGFAVYDVQPAARAAVSTLKINSSLLENGRYRLSVDANGDILSFFDKSIPRELLSSPIRLALQTERPARFPAWNMDWLDRQKPPRAFVSGPAKVRIVETGPARVALEVTRETEESTFVQTIRLAAGGAGDRVEIANAIDWKTRAASLKATFPLAASNPKATYSWEVGTIQRGNNDEKKYEVPSHQWFDLTDTSGAFGVTVLSGAKYGSDKPDDRTLRLTLLYTPGTERMFPDQNTQDWGHHEFVYGLAGHTGDWRTAQTDWQALRLDQPLMAFVSPSHAGALGKTLSLLRVSTPRVRLLAMKKAEESDEVIVRLVETGGESQAGARVTFAAPVAAAREVDAQECALTPGAGAAGADARDANGANGGAMRVQNAGGQAATPTPAGGTALVAGGELVANGELVASFAPYQLRTFAVKLAPPAPASKLAAIRSQAIDLPYDRAVSSRDGAKATPGFDDVGRAVPAEMLPAEIAYGGVRFKLAPAQDGGANAVTAKGQTISLSAGSPSAGVLPTGVLPAGAPPAGSPPAGSPAVSAPPAGGFSRVYVLAASADGDQPALFLAGKRPVRVTVQDWSGYIGQWDNRIWKKVEAPPAPGGANAPAATPSAKPVGAGGAASAPTPAAGVAGAGSAGQGQQGAQPAAAGAEPGTRREPMLGPDGQPMGPSPGAREGGGPDGPGPGQGPGGGRSAGGMFGGSPGEYAGLTPGFIKRDAVAWFASHRHEAAGANEPYAYAYLFAYAFDLPEGATTITLPLNPKIRVMAVTVSDARSETRPAAPLYDEFRPRPAP